MDPLGKLVVGRLPLSRKPKPQTLKDLKPLNKNLKP